jgi:hypothetical protein
MANYYMRHNTIEIKVAQTLINFICSEHYALFSGSEQELAFFAFHSVEDQINVLGKFN